jgi:hypothetical protein
MRMNRPGRRRDWFGRDPKLVQEWLRQHNLIYGGLIAIGVYMVQPFLTATALDLTARICVVAFSVAIPLLAALVVINRQEVFRGRYTNSLAVETTRVVAQLCAFVGVVAGFWHILPIAGVAVPAAGLVAVAVHSAGYVRLEQDPPPTPRPPRTPATPRSSRGVRRQGSGGVWPGPGGPGRRPPRRAGAGRPRPGWAGRSRPGSSPGRRRLRRR